MIDRILFNLEHVFYVVYRKSECLVVSLSVDDDDDDNNVDDMMMMMLMMMKN